MIVCIDHQQRGGAGAGIRLSPDGDSPPSIFDGGDLQLDANSVAGEDFGGIVRRHPAAVSRPSTAADVSRVIQLAARSDSLTVAARGNGHSIHGQAMADDGGVVLDMRSLGLRMELVVSGAGGVVYADVAGGALWEELLAWSVEAHGMAPASWTDYLGLTVGGTLSNGGVSGQSFRHGPQVANVSELEVVTGDGECHVCSPAELPDLFFAALGGLGQFGVITRARIPLLPAPDMVRWMRVVYGRFEDYAADAEWVLTWRESGSFDYVEGFALVNGDDPVNGWGSVPLRAGSRFDPRLVPAGSGPLLYCLEVALHYNRGDGGVDERVGEMLRRLRHVRGLEFTMDVSYVGFLSRVNRAEEEARANGSWFAPHPWLNLLVSAADIADFDRCVLKRILKDGVGGPMLVYPMLRCKWDPRASVAVPESGEVFYLVALLRFGPLSAAAEMVAQNREIISCCDARGYDYKMYLPHYETEREWARHFGPEGWPRFVERKARYDPLRLLSPGQKIFSRALPLPALEPAAPVPRQAPPM